MPTNLLAASKRQRRKKLIKRALLFCLAVIFIFSGAFASLFFIDRLVIKEIKIEGNKAFSESFLKDEAMNFMSGKFLWLIPKNRSFSLSVKDLEDYFLKSFSRISAIEAEKKYLPAGAVTIKIKERAPSAVLCHENGKDCLFLDETGFIFEKAPYFSDGVYIKFMDKRSEPKNIGEFLIDRNRLNEITQFKRIAEQRIKITSVVLKEEGVYEFVDGFGKRLILSDKDDWTAVYANLEAFLKETGATGLKDFKEIDLRFGNKIFYK